MTKTCFECGASYEEDLEICEMCGAFLPTNMINQTQWIGHGYDEFYPNYPQFFELDGELYYQESKRKLFKLEFEDETTDLIKRIEQEGS